MQELQSSDIHECAVIVRGTGLEPGHQCADALGIVEAERSAPQPATPASGNREPEWWSWADIVRHADQLGIPNFQRGAVWDSSNRVALLESIYEQSPCGSFVLWEPGGNADPLRHGVAVRGFAAGIKPMWLVDGQQRTRALLDTFEQIKAPWGTPNCQALVRKEDIERLGHVGTKLHNGANSEGDSGLWFVVLPAMAAFDRDPRTPYFGRHSESQNVRRGSMFRQLHPRARLPRRVPPLPVGLVPLVALLSPCSVFHSAKLRHLAVAALTTFKTPAPDFDSLDQLLPWGPQFATGYAFQPKDGDPSRLEPIRWKVLHAKRQEGDGGMMVDRLLGLFDPEWSKVFERFENMFLGNRFAVGWLPSDDVSAAIDAYVRINRAGIRVRVEERALALLSRAWPQLLDELSLYIRQRGGGSAAGDQRALLVHESDRQMGFGFWMTTVTRYAALALLGGTAVRWLGASAVDKDTFDYRLDRVGPSESDKGKEPWARQYTDPGELIRECAQRATSALILVDVVLSEELFLDHRMARPSARALYPLIDLLYRVPTEDLMRLRNDHSFRAAISRLLHWTLLAPYIDQPDLEQLIVKVHGSGMDGAPIACWNGGVEAVAMELRHALQRYQQELLVLWRRTPGAPSPLPGEQSIRSQLNGLAGCAFESEVGNARSLQHPAVGWLYALERRSNAREFCWTAQEEAFRASDGRIGVERAELTEEALRCANGEDLYPEKQHIVPFSIARLIVGKGGTRATASPANDIGNLTWLSHRQNGLEALGDRWAAMDRDRDEANLAARGMSARAKVDGTDRDVLGIYEELQNMALDEKPWDDKALQMFTAFCAGRRHWMIRQMRAWLDEPLPAGASEWLGDEARASSRVGPSAKHEMASDGPAEPT